MRRSCIASERTTPGAAGRPVAAYVRAKVLLIVVDLLIYAINTLAPGAATTNSICTYHYICASSASGASRSGRLVVASTPASGPDR